MKKYAAIFATALVALGVGACSKGFLSPEDGRYITEEKREELIQDPDMKAKMVTAQVKASYDVFQQYWDAHDNFGLKALQLALDMECEDIAYYGGWFQFDYMWDNFQDNYRRTRSTWGQMYEIIANCNLLLADYFADEPTDPVGKASKGELLGLRGIAFFHLVNFYQSTYVGAEDKMGVPLTLKVTDKDLPRASVKDVYAQILKDLTYAVENRPVTPAHTDVDRGVCAAYLAKAYASMEDWANTAKYAKIAQEGGSDQVRTYPISWSISEADVLFGYDVNASTSTLWASFFSHLDPTLPNYAGGGQQKYIYNWLYNKIGPKDVRRSLWINADDYPEIAKATGLMPEGNPNEYKYCAVKYKTGSEGLTTDYTFMRVQDPILLEMEALNELGQTASAAEKLKAFMEKRDPDFVVLTSQADLREQIRIQRRIELWCEGTNWFDMRRWKLDIDRSKAPSADEQSNHGTIVRGSLNDIRHIHMLPIKELNNNKNLKQDERPKE